MIARVIELSAIGTSYWFEMTETLSSEGTGARGVLELIQELADRLHQAGVVYCHWKSNESLSGAVAGENDLDLLIARSDMPVFSAILHDLGFRVARPDHERQLPGILDFYGLDKGSGCIVHVHAHTQLVLGDDMTKNFRLPIERAYLASVGDDGVIPTPHPEFEYFVFVIRMVLKHSTWDAQLARKGKLALSERRERSDLEATVDHDEVHRIRERCLPLVDRELFEDCKRALGAASRLERIFISRRLLAALDSLGRRSRNRDLLLRIARRQRRRIQAYRGIAGKRLDDGGLIIAVVGGDGSGKSTTVESLYSHLAKDLRARRIHLGKPPRSLVSRLIRRIMRRARAFGLFGSTRLPPWTDFENLGFPGYGYLVWHLLIGRDRFHEYRRARRAANAGEIVICDRFPLDAIRLMDGRRLSNVPGTESRVLARVLVRMEDSYYRRILPPDLVIVMRVQPDVAVGRRSDDPEPFVRFRANEILDIDWSPLNVVVVDAGEPLDLVQQRVREAVWTEL